MNLPEEIIYKILSHLPPTVLTELKLTNKEYWNIFRQNNPCKWQGSIDWKEKITLPYTAKMILEREIYIMTLGGLQYGGDKYLFDNTTEVYFTKTDTESNKKNNECTYDWKPIQETENKKAYFKRLSSMTHISECQLIKDVFKKHLQEYISPELYEVNEDILKIPTSFVTFYLKDIPNLETDKIDLAHKVTVDEYIVWVVSVIKKDKTKHEIGRAVCAYKFFKNLKSNQIQFIDNQIRVFISESPEGKILNLIKNNLSLSK